MPLPNQMNPGGGPPPMGGLPPGGAPPGGKPAGIIDKNASMFNPADMAKTKMDMQGQPEPTVREFFQKLGVDVDGPVSQLKSLAQKQMQNANPLSKMQNIARSGGAPPPGRPSPGPPPGAMQEKQPGMPPKPGAGMEGLI